MNANQDSYYDKYADYEDQFNPLHSDRKARKARKPKIKHTPKKDEHQLVQELADTVGLEGGFKSTYHPGPFEEGWLLSSLRDFYNQHLISDVLSRVKGGKEASIYRCQATAAIGGGVIAAKVYRPNMFRNLRNDAMYREGRGLLSAEGNDMNQSVHVDRVQRALGKKTAYGMQVAHTSWLMHEFTSLQTLHAAGAKVPKVYAASENAILMSFHGDEQMAAPILQDVELDPDEAADLFKEVMQNVELMLQHDLIHGDLSAYNILYWEGEITIIDFPQVVNSKGNGNARFVLERDVTRICDYFAAQGVEHDPAAITKRLWKRYVAKRPQDQKADESRLLGEEWE
ncbi:MAG TPA: RIO1 family regulatory kinase/ATPase [Phototrophicaceae bacterium]|nr:RIO1 family regulatory kinase/ATPase [Phototrophicaceae bacterium]